MAAHHSEDMNYRVPHAMTKSSLAEALLFSFMLSGGTSEGEPLRLSMPWRSMTKSFAIVNSSSQGFVLNACMTVAEDLVESFMDVHFTPSLILWSGKLPRLLCSSCFVTSLIVYLYAWTKCKEHPRLPRSRRVWKLKRVEVETCGGWNVMATIKVVPIVMVGFFESQCVGTFSIY